MAGPADAAAAGVRLAALSGTASRPAGSDMRDHGPAAAAAASTSSAAGRCPGSPGVGQAYGTFGELLQGALPEADGDFLVTMPIARWSTAVFHREPGLPRVTVWPPHKTKARTLAGMIIADRGAGTAGGTLVLRSELPEGKGLASSSADLVAAARAVSGALGIELPADRLEDYLRRIEPTDGVLHPGVVAYHHRAVRIRSTLGSLPPVSVVGVDEGGEVDTVEFNRLPKPFSAADRHEYAGLLDRLTAAVRAGDLAEVGRVSTRSAVKNQRLRPKRLLAAVREVSRELGGLGVICAHSGTTVGVLLDDADPGYADRLARVTAACRRLAGNATVYPGLTFDLPAPRTSAGGHCRG
ncbi:kinase [Micromonospora sp. NPDC048830]|uniref:GHMP family kinase ATP-binding protein n=1 Tax=Micromonospora sp. NPDC048830 TaxID=3364257 RepID=UPI003723F966